MSEPQVQEKKSIDPLDPWREMREAYMKVWAQTMGDAVKTEEYAKANGAVLDGFLSAAAPLREVQTKVMASALDQMNMPSRADFMSLADRVNNVELLLDDMNAKLSAIQRLLEKTVQAAEKTMSASQPSTAKAEQPAHSESVAETEAVL